MSDITVIVPFYNGNEYLPVLLATLPSDWDVIVVDDLSDVPPKSESSNVTILHLNKKGYFTGAVNAGIKACNTDILILNQDVYFQDRRALRAVKKYRQEGYAMVGESIKGTHPAWPKSYIHGTFMFVTREVINKIGLMDEKYYPLWGSTCEWQLRACRKDFKVLPLREIPGMVHQRKGKFGSSIAEVLRKFPDKRNLLVRTPPLISVIVPCYNHGKYLPDLISSLIGGSTVEGESPGQTLQSFEVIIADDSSTDETAEIARSLADPWKGIHYVKTQRNSGTSAACNLAISRSHSSVIARIDGDDMREPHSLELLYDALHKSPHSFAYDDAIMLTPNGRKTKPWKLADYDFDQLIYKNQVHAGIMFPKQAWSDVGGYPEEMRYGRDDWAFNVALGLKGYCGIHVNRPGYIYRRHGNNRTLQNTTPAHRYEFAQAIQELFPEAYAEVRPMGCCGGRKSSRSQTTLTPSSGGTYSMKTLTGSRGMAKVEYLGANYGKETYYGPVTGIGYTFSLRAKIRFVDRRDLHTDDKRGLLDLYQGKSPLFRVVTEAVTARSPSKPELPTISDIAESTEDSDMVAFYVAELSAVKGIGEKSAKALVDAGYLNLEHITQASADQLQEDLGWTVSRVSSLKRKVADAV